MTTQLEQSPQVGYTYDALFTCNVTQDDSERPVIYAWIPGTRKVRAAADAGLRVLVNVLGAPVSAGQTVESAWEDRTRTLDTDWDLYAITVEPDRMGEYLFREQLLPVSYEATVFTIRRVASKVTL